jgi:arylsulfatase A-like enzyme
VATPVTKPNVVWIVLDALRAQNLHCYGYDRETSPNIDRLAGEGAIFDLHFAQTFWTLESFNSYMSGRYFPVNYLDSGNWQGQMRAPVDGEAILPAILSENGYQTMACVPFSWFTPFCRFWKALDHPLHFGDGWREVSQRMRDFLRHRDERPFFMYFHLLDTHFPHRLEKPFNKWVDAQYVSKTIVDGAQPGRPAEPFTPEDRKLLTDLYDGGVLRGDWMVGRILSKLRTLGLLENTVVVIAADHGETLGEDGWTVGHDWSICDETMHVPLIISGPGIPRGVRVSRITENVDIVPTLVDLLNLETSATFDGQSLTPQWRNPDNPVSTKRNYAFARDIPSWSKDSGHFVLRSAQYAYVYSIVADRGALHAAPFSIGSDLDLSSSCRDIASAMRNTIVESFLPKWEEFKRLPEKSPTEPFLAKAYSTAIDLPDSMPPGSSDSEGGEAQAAGRGWSIEDGDVVFGGSGKTTPASLTVRYEIPSGTYDVIAAVTLIRTDPTSTAPSGVFEMEVQEGPALKTVALNQTGSSIVNMGEYVVGDGVISLRLTPSEEYSFRLGKLLLMPAGEQSAPEAAQILLDREDVLRALGYL